MPIYRTRWECKCALQSRVHRRTHEQSTLDSGIGTHCEKDIVIEQVRLEGRFKEEAESKWSV